MPVLRKSVGVTGDGISVERFTLRSAAGVEADILSYGGSLAALRTPDRSGTIGNVVLGFDRLEPYLGPQRLSFYRFHNTI